ncbi:hypothetical protein [Acidovorax soli]|uniref:Uncharacterized protein n=1 Tax=Acidovorax soli TaxID=592050 RepID=A0A1H3VI09_9BURK|nr:hypothetical protein [Acidovorax soli]SDZ73798.1 hypothetical protein SAMN05421875_101125 [Acidovorax soli]
MAYFIPSDTPLNPTEARAHAAPAAGPRTPANHLKDGVTKPIRLLALGTGEYGKTALLEFPGGWQRTIDLPTEADAWHPLFSELSQEDCAKLRSHAAPPVIRRPDGTRTRRGALSFITKDIHRGRWVKRVNSFDVPAENGCAGSVTGYRCAAELLDALARDYGPCIDKRDIIKAALQACNEPYGKPSRRNAGLAFMDIVEEALNFMAKHAKHREYMAAKIAQAEHVQAYMADHDAREKAAFVERMKAAKAAKRSKAQRSDA